MELYFDIGGNVVRVTAPECSLALAGTMLEKFLIPECDWRVWIDLQFCDKLPIPQGTLLFENPERRVWYHPGSYVTEIGSATHPALQVTRRDGESSVLADRNVVKGIIQSHVLLKAIEAEHLIVAGEGFLLHSSFIEYEGKAILFTAPSGTGKSTQAALWAQLRGARIINGDRSVVRRGAHGFEAHGVPFCGSSGISEPARLPLAAIVVLSQAPRTEIRPLSGIRAFRAVWEGCSLHTWNSEDVARCSETVADAIARVPVYHLACTPDESAVLALEKTLRK